MPFDGRNKAKDRGYQLVYALRNIEKLQWEWDFSVIEDKCGTAGCALGLAQKLWPEMADAKYVDENNIIDEDTVGGFFGLPETRESYWDIFDRGLANRLGKPMADITPEMVADALEEALNAV